MNVAKKPQNSYLSSFREGGRTIKEQIIRIPRDIPPKEKASNSSLNKDIKIPIFIISDYYLKLFYNSRISKINLIVLSGSFLSGSTLILVSVTIIIISIKSLLN
jgi:hypothetical protein